MNKFPQSLSFPEFGSVEVIHIPTLFGTFGFLLPISVNLHRRHLDPSQRAMVALEAEKYLAEEAKARQIAHLKKGDEVPVMANLPERNGSTARDEAARLVGVSGRLI